ncbi:uncharacterized protein J4E84_009250 [Alternaria hordeiaustralica]|uniref:uncharacterized protein n=1 Tax=Alternaria hordeiaustralica TaxID=1187925 RepID=UPI0020C319D0|nr:uncharacterized protein J4E84_009250 [Alternaria hordeiaustralica]KAI4676950.1 hypothetical protein J4E84_009250 [Alternaria hordeiaustralica]
MEALTAIGLIANIVQFVDLGAKLVGSAKEMRDSASGMTLENKSLEDVTIEMRDLSSSLDPPTTDAESYDERVLRQLARECRELSDQILRLLKKIAPTRPGSRRQIAGSLIKNQKYRKEKKELGEKLADCRRRLHLQFDKFTSSEVRAQLQALGNRAQSNQAILQTLPQQIERVRRGTCVASLGVEALDQLKDLLGLTEVAQESVVARSFLNDLAFEGMEARADVIAKEHSETFRWIVEQDADVDDVTLKTNARELYLSWLHHACGIFHIAGKLGSGKSTLMKFLYKHPETRKQLLAWADNKTLVMASHFFWKPAKLNLQKSLTGLERSSLYQLLSSHPELTKKAFPEIWEHRMSIKDDRMELPHSLSPDEIRDGFMALLRDETVQQSYRFCFFIDALDEYEDIPQYDQKYMVDTLRKWTQISPNSIKLCVSSREENVFENAFAGDPRIRLQDLTRHDMECFVRSRLESVQDHNTRERLKSEIVKKSDGIFFWVVLVTKQLRQALEDGDDASVFERELATLPTELKKLFNHLLDSISPLRRERAHQIFAMVLKHETLPIKLSLLSCLHLDANEMNALSSVEEPSILPVMDYQDGQDPQKWGLVEDRDHPEVCKQEGGSEDPRPEPDPSKPAGSRCILFVHRTVIEFLEESSILKHELGEFDAIEAISQSHLAEFQRIPSSLINPLYWTYLYGKIIELRFHSGKDRSQGDFLVQLEHLISRKFPGWLEKELPPSEECVDDAADDYCQLIVLFLQKYERNVVHRTKIEYGGQGEFGGWECTVMKVKVPGKVSADMIFRGFTPGTTCHTISKELGHNASMEQLVKLWHLENEREILGLLEQERRAMESKEQAADLVVTAKETSEKSSSDSTPAFDTASRSLQRVDSAAEIRSESGVTASCPPVETKEDVDTPQSKAAKTRSIHALGIATGISLLGEKISIKKPMGFR